jgi:hypothetical protein
MHVCPQREPLRAMTKAPLKRFEAANQALYARGRRAIDHRAGAYPIHAIRYKLLTTIHEHIPE